MVTSIFDHAHPKFIESNFSSLNVHEHVKKSVNSICDQIGLTHFWPRPLLTHFLISF